MEELSIDSISVSTSVSLAVSMTGKSLN